MKMFVWRDVLIDYTSGIAVALANDEDEARKVIIRDAEDYEKKTLAGDIIGPPDEIYDKPTGVHVWGGG